MLIYPAGQYSAPTHEGISANIAVARKYAILLWEAGHVVISPHLNSAHFEVDCKCVYEDYLRADFKIIARCDALFMLPGWEQSKGACREKAYAESLKLAIYDWRDGIPALHQTEVTSPIQVEAFAEILGQMYRTHLNKNADYSPGNILGPGEPGLATRIWDKSIRLMNLIGFKVYMWTNDHPKTLWQKFLYLVQGRVVVIDEIIYTEPRKPKNESIEDNLIDAAVYPIIHLLFRQGKWGK